MIPSSETISALEDLGEQILAVLAKDVDAYRVAHGELMITVAPASLIRVLTVLRDDVNFQFKQLMDVCSVDYPDRTPRFEVVYNLLSLSQNVRVRIKVPVEEGASVPSATDTFNSANWWEREVWDLMGIYFSGHPDLRRIMTDYGFEGHPLRKDFPLTGYVEVRYDDDLKRVVYEPVKLQQEFRSFDFLSPWEGAPVVLPGDEKASEGDAAED